MKQSGLALLLGTLLALPLLYVLELSNPGAITFLILICVALTATVISIVNKIRKREAKE